MADGRQVEEHTISRRHAAILAADIVDYGRHMADDEVETYARVKALLTALFEPTVIRHGGRIVRLIGDGALVEFASAPGAVASAIEIQRAMASRHQGVARARRIAFRIGINFGEVIVDGDAIDGHGVVIAGRLESLADPDGIFVAQSVYEQIKSEPRLRTAYLGERLIKNVSEPIPVYRVLLESQPCAADRAVGPAASPETVPAQLPIPACPYRGLFAFREEDAPYFFGRAQSTAELERAVQHRPVVVLLGPSGSGKSSVVFAGLIPRLRAQDSWLITSFRPDAKPFASLGRALGGLLGQTQADDHLRARLMEEPDDIEDRCRALIELVSRILERAPERRLLLIGDQLEQIYTLCQEPDERDRFIEALLAAGRDSLDNEAPRTVILLTLRADFLGQALSSRAFADALRGGDVKLGPMSDDELRAVIENPARKLGVRFEMGLVDRILTDVQGQPGGLPLLEFALTELWAQQRHGRLSHLGYQDIGGVAEAIAGYAERIYRDLEEPEQERVRQIFLQLVRPGHGTEDTRRIASRAEIHDQRWATVTRLANARLVVTQHDEGSGEDVAEVVHEALIREWHRLRQWVDADREFLVWRQRLAEARREWERYQRADGFLLRETPLAVALDWRESRGDELAQADRTFIEASRARQEREEQEREGRRREHEAELHRAEIERQRLEAEAARHLARRTRTAAMALTLVALIAAGFGWWGYDRSVEAEKQRAVAEEHASVATQQREVAVAAQLEAERNEGRSRAAEQNALAEKQRAQDETKRAQIKESQLLALLSRQETARGDAVTGMLLALKGLPEAFEPLDRPIEAEATRALIAAIQMQQELIVLRGHEGEVWSAAFSPDGARIVTASKDGTARLWDAASGAELAVLRGHEGELWSVAFSPDGARIVTASADATARVWDAASGAELATLRGHEREVRSAAFSPDGARIVTASRDFTVRVWDTEGGAERVVLRGHEGEVMSAAFSPDGDRIVTASEDATVRVWHAASGTELAVLRGHGGEVWSAAFSPDGARIVTASRDFTVRVWDTEGGAERAVLRGHEGEVWSAAFSPDGARIVTASRDFTARLWGVASGAELGVLRGHEGEVWAAAFSPDGARIVTASQDGTARVWSAASRAERAVLRGHEHWIMSAAFSPEGDRIVTAAMDGTARIWDAQSGKELIVVRGDENGLWTALFSPDGTRMLTAQVDGTARIWDAASGTELAVLRGHEGEVRSPAFSPDGARIVTASWDRTARLWDAASGQEVAVLRGHDGELWSAAFSPDGDRILTASEDTTARLWHAVSGAELAVLRGHESVVRSAAFSPDGDRIVTASRDGTARLWDAASGAELAVLRGHEGEVRSAAFSPDGGRIVTTSSDRTARVWGAASGAELAVLRGHEDWVSSAAFSPDGNRIVTASDDGTARLWDAASGAWLAALPVDELVAEAKRQLPRQLTPEQEERFFLAK